MALCVTAAPRALGWDQGCPCPLPGICNPEKTSTRVKREHRRKGDLADHLAKEKGIQKPWLFWGRCLCTRASGCHGQLPEPCHRQHVGWLLVCSSTQKVGDEIKAGRGKLKVRGGSLRRQSAVDFDILPLPLAPPAVNPSLGTTDAQHVGELKALAGSKAPALGSSRNNKKQVLLSQFHFLIKEDGNSDCGAEE